MTDEKLPAKGPGGAPEIPVDPYEVEKSAALGMNMQQIAEGLGISERTLHRRKGSNQAVLSAYKRGRYRAQQQALQELHKHSEKNPISNIFKTKHLMGWYDSNTLQVTGTIEHKVSPAQEAYQLRQAAKPVDDGDVIDAEYTDVSET